MKSHLIWGLVLAVAMSALALPGCNTLVGVGRDIEALGNAGLDDEDKDNRSKDNGSQNPYR